MSKKLEQIARNAEQAAALPERDRRLALLLLNGHLTKGDERWTNSRKDTPRR